MATVTTDPLGVVAEKQADINLLSTLAGRIAAYAVSTANDLQGLKDMQIKAAELSFRLNSLSSVDGNNAGTAFSQFALENVSTS